MIQSGVVFLWFHSCHIKLLPFKASVFQSVSCQHEMCNVVFHMFVWIYTLCVLKWPNLALFVFNIYLLSMSFIAALNLRPNSIQNYLIYIWIEEGGLESLSSYFCCPWGRLVRVHPRGTWTKLKMHLTNCQPRKALFTCGVTLVRL